MENAASRLRLALEMHEVGVRMYRQRMRREHPEESADEVATRVQRWLLDRPGDCPGRIVNRFE